MLHLSSVARRKLARNEEKKKGVIRRYTPWRCELNFRVVTPSFNLRFLILQRKAGRLILLCSNQSAWKSHEYPKVYIG
jgi:hypothetical protein